MKRAIATTALLYFVLFLAIGFLCFEDRNRTFYRSFYKFKDPGGQCAVRIKNKYRKILVKKDNDGYCTIYILKR